MEKISDFFKDLKDRISTPLMSSFIIAWLILNWRIIIGLFKYNNNELKIDGYKSYIDLIGRQSNSYDYFWNPLGLAIIYTIVFPLLKVGLNWYAALTKRWGNNAAINASRKTNVSIDKYIQLRNTYQQLTESLAEIVKSESLHQIENNELKIKNLSLTQELNDSKDNLRYITGVNILDFLDGEWEYSQGETINRIYIGQQKIRDVKNPSSEETILKVFVDHSKDEIIMFTQEKHLGIKSTYNLQISKGFDVLRGSKDVIFDVKFERISSSNYKWRSFFNKAITPII